MKNSLDAAKDVRSLINVPAVTNLISGKIWLVALPGVGNIRTTGDIVIKTIHISNEINQEGAVSINIYLPNIQAGGSDKIDAMPDMAKFDQLLSVIIPLVESQYGEDFSTEIDIPGDVIKSPDGSWLLHISVIYRSYNKQYNNI